MPSLVGLIIYAVIAAVIAGVAYTAWNGFKEKIAAPYVQAQMQADEVVVTKANKAQEEAEAARSQAEGEKLACETISNKQTAKTNDLAKQSADNFALAHQIKVKSERDAIVAAPKIADLRAKAAAAPKLMECKEELAKTDKVLRDALKTKRNISLEPTDKKVDPVKALNFGPLK